MMSTCSVKRSVHNTAELILNQGIFSIVFYGYIRVCCIKFGYMPKYPARIWCANLAISLIF
ncbi:hypothetical protein TI04_05935 [Achromatium sp. WMS2]|nr:hypothetical protein TI04_05935 [Achromatium sp. WMS2]